MSTLLLLLPRVFLLQMRSIIIAFCDQINALEDLNRKSVQFGIIIFLISNILCIFFILIICCRFTYDWQSLFLGGARWRYKTDHRSQTNDFEWLGTWQTMARCWTRLNTTRHCARMPNAISLCTDVYVIRLPSEYLRLSIVLKQNLIRNKCC